MHHLNSSCCQFYAEFGNYSPRKIGNLISYVFEINRVICLSISTRQPKSSFTYELSLEFLCNVGLYIINENRFQWALQYIMLFPIFRNVFFSRFLTL